MDMVMYCKKCNKEEGPCHHCSCELAQLRAELAEAKQLLSDIRADLIARAEIDLYDGGTVLNISNGLLLRIDAAMEGKS